MKQREGVLVDPWPRLNRDQLLLLDQASRELLEDPGVLCTNPRVITIFREKGAAVEEAGNYQRIRISSSMLDTALESAPAKIVLGARDPNNRLILDAAEPRCRFGSGAETNVWLDVTIDEAGEAQFHREDGSIERLCRSAHLCEHLEHLDFFIRNVNIRDTEVTDENKDVNKFLASLNNITKHVQAGLTSLSALDDVIRMGEIIAGGPEAFEKNPVLSFIACVIKSPLEFVPDTSDKVIEIAKRKVPIVISSCPLGGTTGPFDEFGMVAQINAELLAGVVLTQLVAPGAPVLYGSVPVRSRLDTLDDMYGAPEFNHYNMSCAQLARYYGLPCYSTAGVADCKEPGIQATFEKMLTLGAVPLSGAQYIHYAFGLLERTNTFCPVQAVMDDIHIGILKRSFASAKIDGEKKERAVSLIREIMGSPDRTYMYHLPMPSREDVYVRYPLHKKNETTLAAAHRKYHEILSRPANPLPEAVRQKLQKEIPGILPSALAAPVDKEAD
jgi:trimethylamine---corrinoid protein Co-methyltransferase